MAKKLPAYPFFQRPHTRSWDKEVDAIIAKAKTMKPDDVLSYADLQALIGTNDVPTAHPAWQRARKLLRKTHDVTFSNVPAVGYAIDGSKAKVHGTERYVKSARRRTLVASETSAGVDVTALNTQDRARHDVNTALVAATLSHLNGQRRHHAVLKRSREIEAAKTSVTSILKAQPPLAKV